MFLQTLFACSALIPAITAFVPSSIGPSTTLASMDGGLGLAHVQRSSITIMGGRRFAAEVFAPKSVSSESRYPGAIIVATEATRDRAFLIASRMSEIGVTVIMYLQREDGTHRLRVYDAMAAVDSMRHRGDVRTDEVGIIAFEEATTVVPDLVRDTTLGFAIAASGDSYGRDLSQRYKAAHAATLVVQGVDSLGNVLVRILPVPPDTVMTMSEETGLPKVPSLMAPNVTLWPVPKAQLEEIGEAHSPLGQRLVTWIREQVHVAPAVSQQPIAIH